MYTRSDELTYMYQIRWVNIHVPVPVHDKCMHSLRNILPAGAGSLGKVDAPRRPVVFNFTEEGSKPNGPNPPPVDN